MCILLLSLIIISYIKYMVIVDDGHEGNIMCFAFVRLIKWQWNIDVYSCIIFNIYIGIPIPI